MQTTWPLPNSLTTKIGLFAGREASAALCIALSGHDKNAGISKAEAASEALFSEPFTYWDWCGLPENDTTAKEHKRRRMWEHRKGHRTEAHGCQGYPTARERWDMFKSRIEERERRSKRKDVWVKRIAVAHWMGRQELLWIAKHLQGLVGLDLSDSRATYPGTTGGALWLFFFATTLWEEFIQVLDLFHRLEWLGLPDFRQEQDLWQAVLPKCTALETLSIRGPHTSRFYKEQEDPHTAVCGLIYAIAEYSPPTVTRLELRMTFYFLDRLISELKKRNSSIQHFGIDLGAWIQTFNANGPMLNDIEDDRLRSSARIVALQQRQQRLHAYAEEHTKHLPSQSKWWLPKSKFEEPEEANATGDREVNTSDNTFDEDFFRRISFTQTQYMDRHPNRLNEPCPFEHDDNALQELKKDLATMKKCTTAIGILNKLYEVAQGADGATKFFALNPEWQLRSQDPLHPHTLFSVTIESSAYIHDDAYSWLRKTFHWQPVFDWDSLMRPDLDNDSPRKNQGYDLVSQRRMPGIRNPNSDKAKESWIASRKDRSTDQVPLFSMRKAIEMMRKAGIPFHVLIGRRHPDGSSLYWGWPYDKAAWDKLLKKPFDAELKEIAPVIDVLTIAYDMRNPLDEARLEQIDALSPQHPPTEPVRERSKKNLPLAANVPWLPPAGEYADAHPEDDSDSEANMTPPAALHHIARRASYEREAIYWQRFWNAYAPRLKNLSRLEVRMPRAFDKVGSVRLAKLLIPNKQWHMATFADERQHMQLREDLVRFNRGYEHEPERKIRPGGRFVRRSWVLKDKPEHLRPRVPVTALNRGTDDMDEYSDEEESDDEAAIVEREKEELAKGIARANETEACLRSEETKLLESRQEPLPTPPQTDLDRRLSETAYGIHLRNYTAQQWQQRIRAFITELRAWEVLPDAQLNTLVGASATDTERIRAVLKSTRENLERRLEHFDASDFFELKEGKPVREDKKFGIRLKELRDVAKILEERMENVAEMGGEEGTGSASVGEEVLDLLKHDVAQYQREADTRAIPAHTHATNEPLDSQSADHAEKHIVAEEPTASAQSARDSNTQTLFGDPFAFAHIYDHPRNPGFRQDNVSDSEEDTEEDDEGEAQKSGETLNAPPPTTQIKEAEIARGTEIKVEAQQSVQDSETETLNVPLSTEGEEVKIIRTTEINVASDAAEPVASAQAEIVTVIETAEHVEEEDDDLFGENLEGMAELVLPSIEEMDAMVVETAEQEVGRPERDGTPSPPRRRGLTPRKEEPPLEKSLCKKVSGKKAKAHPARDATPSPPRHRSPTPLKESPPPEKSPAKKVLGEKGKAKPRKKSESVAEPPETDTATATDLATATDPSPTRSTRSTRGIKRKSIADTIPPTPDVGTRRTRSSRSATPLHHSYTISSDSSSEDASGAKKKKRKRTSKKDEDEGYEPEPKTSKGKGKARAATKRKRKAGDEEECGDGGGEGEPPAKKRKGRGKGKKGGG